MMTNTLKTIEKILCRNMRNESNTLVVIVTL
jgi:hypothetical protein